MLIRPGNLFAKKAGRAWFQTPGQQLDAKDAAAAWDFLNDRYQEGGVVMSNPISFIRASTATYYDIAGTLKTAALNTPRYDFDPDTLQPRGLLVEGSATNFLRYSEEIDNAVWVKTQSSVIPNNTTSPDGNATADTLFDNATNNQHMVAQSYGIIGPGAPYTYSVFLKNSTSGWARVEINNSGSFTFTFINLTTGAIGNNGVSGSTLSTPIVSVEKLPNGWFRLRITVTATNNAGWDIRNCVQTANAQFGYLGTGTNAFHMFGAQLEQREGRSSYIKTENYTLPRAADIFTRTLGSWYNAAEGTFYTDFVQDYTPAANFPRIMEIHDGTASNNMVLFDRDTSLYSAAISAGAVSQLDNVGSAYTPGTVGKMALAYKLNDSQFVYAGTAFGVDNTVTVPTVTTWQFGNRADGLRPMYGWIRSAYYYNFRGTQAGMVTRTT